MCRRGGMDVCRRGGRTVCRHGGMDMLAWRHGYVGMEAGLCVGMEAWTCRRGGRNVCRHANTKFIWSYC